jgi:hypothetical protein
MKTVIFTTVLLLSGAAMATERNSGGLLGGMPAPQSEPRGQTDWGTWEPSRGRANMPPEGQKLLDQLQAGEITGKEFRYGMGVIGKRREEQERRGEEQR